jgi:hypothetical protein
VREEVELLEYHADMGAHRAQLRLAIAHGFEPAAVGDLLADQLALEVDAPAVGYPRKLMQRSSVLLPDPLAPITHTSRRDAP